MYIALLLAIPAVAYLLYGSWRLYTRIKIGLGLVTVARAFSRTEGKTAVLVLGDSTAASVGSPPELSVPGRLSRLLDASVENHSKSGARARDIVSQLARASRTHYDLIHIHVGANDVIHLVSLEATERSMRKALSEAKKLSKRILFLTAGHIDDAPVFPWWIHWLMMRRTVDLRRRFIDLAGETGAVYVDIYPHPQSFHSDKARYYAPDGLHLTGDGYGFWFGIVEGYVRKNWPELIKDS